MPSKEFPPFPPSLSFSLSLSLMRAMNRIIEEAIRDVSFNAKVLPELPQDTKFCVEQNEKKVWWGAEATSQLVTHWFQHIEK